MSSSISGKNGAVMLGTNKVAEISDWTMDFDVDNVDVTSFDSAGWKEFLNTLVAWSGKLEGNAVPGDTTGQQAIFMAATNGASGAATLAAVFKMTTTVPTITGTILVKKVSYDVPVADKVKFSVDYQGTGTLTPAWS
jgi:predicted secreted protein